MTRLDAIKVRAQAATEGCTAGTPADYALIRHAHLDIPWLLAQVAALAVAARLSARKGCHDTCSKALVSDCACDCGYEALTAALAALEAPDA